MDNLPEVQFPENCLIIGNARGTFVEVAIEMQEAPYDMCKHVPVCEGASLCQSLKEENIKALEKLRSKFSTLKDKNRRGVWQINL